MTTLDAVAERIVRGERLSEADARTILDTRDLIAIGMMADEARQRLHGRRTTFCRVLEVHVDLPSSPVPGAVAAGEVRIVGRPASLEAAVEAVRAAVNLAQGAPVTGFLLSDVERLCSDQESMASICRRLADAGLAAISEVPLDEMENPAGAVREARAAGVGVFRLTVHTMTDWDPISIVTRARDLQDELGGFRVFAPLPRTFSATTPSTGYDDVKQVALARLVATNIDSIQVDWALYGPKLAQVALTVGADDVDAVAAVDPGTLGTRRSPLEEIKGNMKAASLDAVERDALFEVRK